MSLMLTPAQAGQADRKGFRMSDCSLEITARELPWLEQAAHRIDPGTRIAITFLPGEDYADRIQAAQAVRRLGFEPVPHLSARRIAGAAELEDFLRALVARAGVDRVFVVGGDAARPMGPYGDALDLIRSGILARHGIREVGLAAYPEGHPQIPDERLMEALRDKTAALREQAIAAFIVTQFGFKAEPILQWVREIRRQGIDCPVRIGVPGPARLGTLLRYAARCGVGTSARVMGRYGLSARKLIGSVGPAVLLSDLAAGLGQAPAGDLALHFYAFGDFEETVEWVRAFVERHPGGFLDEEE